MQPPQLTQRDVRPLKEKLKDHWEKRHEVMHPTGQKANQLGIICFWSVLLGSVYIGFWMLAPYFARRSVSSAFYMKIWVLYLFFQNAVNWWLTYSTRCRATRDNVPQIPREASEGATGAISRDGWTYCAPCQLDVPPRSHHCKVCGECVLKRDHHCYFTGYCVGFHNQRRFVVFCFYVALSAVYFLYHEYKYIQGPIPDRGSWFIVITVWKWATGAMSFRHLCLIVHMYAFFFLGLVGAAFFLWEMSVILMGQTSYEAYKGVHKYSGGTLLERIRFVFGPYGLLNFLLPLPTKPEGDGVNWMLLKSLKRH